MRDFLRFMKPIGVIAVAVVAATLVSYAVFTPTRGDTATTRQEPSTHVPHVKG